KGLRIGKALALPGRSRIHLVFGMGFGRRDRGLSQQRRPQGDRAAHARAERGEGGGQALRARAIAAKRVRSRLLDFLERPRPATPAFPLALYPERGGMAQVVARPRYPFYD